MESAKSTVPLAPSKRCAIASKNGKEYLFVVVPKPPPAPKKEIEPLMFFDTPTSPSATAETTSKNPSQGSLYHPGSAWSGGSVVVPLQVTGSGSLCRSMDFGETELASLAEVKTQCGPFTIYQEYAALFGCLRIDRVYALVATAVEHYVELPFSGVIKKIDGTAWIPFQIPGAAPIRVSAPDKTRLREFQEYTHYKGYYYCDDVDVTLPFPFTHSDDCTVPNFACDWSYHLRDPFESCFLTSACSVLIRGFVGERTCVLKDGVKLHLLLIGRQNNTNPGPRYLGRGLNAANGAGNDHFYEYVMWKLHGPNTITFTRHSILRGTIPVHWTTEVGMSLSEPAMIFSSDKAEVQRGSSTYFEQTFLKLKQTMLLDTGGKCRTNPQLRCINLLRLNPQNGEGVLARHFLDAVRASDPVIKNAYPGGSLDLVHVDWLNLIKDYGIDVATSTFWEASMGFLGTTTAPEDSMMTVGMVRRTGEVDRLIAQSRFVRVNCADSLDRTNLGCFFTCLQVTIAMLLTQRIPFSNFPESPAIPNLDASEETGGSNPYAAAFTPVSGAKQVVQKPFLNTWNEAREPARVPPMIVRALAELFVWNGDCVAMLYTNSAAMHGNILRGVCGMRLTGFNAVIATQRKYENVFEDRKKFRSIELLLGRNQGDHFPSLSQVFLLRPVPYVHWACAILLLSVPETAATKHVEDAIRQCWDTAVLPRLPSLNVPPIESSALCLTITLPGQSEQQDHDVLASTFRQISFSSSPPPEEAGESISEDGSVRSRCERIAVIEFDTNLCSVIDAPMLVRQQGYVTVCGQNCITAPYSYPVQNSTDSGGMGDAVKNVGTSLKRGIKNFVRGLN